MLYKFTVEIEIELPDEETIRQCFLGKNQTVKDWVEYEIYHTKDGVISLLNSVKDDSFYKYDYNLSNIVEIT